MTFLRMSSTCLALALGFGGLAHAAYPDKPLRLIVPWSAGGSSDVIARAVAQRMGETLGQSMIVDNRSGASGRIGLELAAKSAPDGYTLALVELPHAIAPAVFTHMSYDLLRDFAPVSTIGESPLILFADSATYKTADLQRFLDDARKTSKPLLLATSGNGSISHLSAKLLEAQTGVKVDVVPYRGSAPALMDVVAHQVTGHFSTLASASSLLDGGKVVPLMTTGATRTPILPNVPTAIELKIPGMRFSQWWALVVPAKTPTEIVDRLSKELNKALEHGPVRDRLSGQGIQLKGSSPAQLGAFMKSEVAKWARVVRESGIEAE